MSGAWWGRERSGADAARIVRGRRGPQPEPISADPEGVRAAIRDRILAFTPEWSRLDRDDAGVALVRLFSFELEPVLRRANRLPDKMLVEYLATAGVRPRPGTPAETLLRITVAPAAPRAVRVPEGSRYAAPPANGEGDLVTFETVAGISATAAEIAEVIVQEGGRITPVELPEPGSVLLPFGYRPGPGRALWIGLTVDHDPGASLSLGILVAAPPGAPPPVAQGGLLGIAAVAGPILRWEALGADGAEPAEVIMDETGGLVRSGVIELGVPRSWRPGRPSLLGEGESRRWVRVRIAHGRFPAPPAFGGLFLNAVRAQARRTIRNEALEVVSSPRAGRTTMRLSQTPVLPGSVVLEVDEGVAADVFGVADDSEATGTTVRRWRETEDLSASGPDDRVFVLDPGSGELTFGDGVDGMRVPQGFRNVVAARYRVGGGAGGAVDAEAVTTILTAVPFVSAVTNPVRASGGTDTEPTESVVRRGPREIRSRGRAVTVTDYELLAQRAPGATIARAHAVAGAHPAHPGRPLPGVVGVYVIPPDRGEGPPTPDEGALRAVARYLSDRAAPAGVEVVAAAPRYHEVRAEAQLIVDAAADPGTVVRAVTLALDEYLHPITGGDAGRGWPFGGAIRYVPLMQRVLGASREVRAVPRLDVIVDGIRAPRCADHRLAANALLWPGGHEVVAIPERESP